MAVRENFMCFNCKHLRQLSGGCDAFPDGIPDEIAEEGQPHNEPLPGQGNDIVFEPMESEEDQMK